MKKKWFRWFFSFSKKMVIFRWTSGVRFPGRQPLWALLNPWHLPRYSADGEVQQARCFCVVVKERNYHMESWQNIRNQRKIQWKDFWFLFWCWGALSNKNMFEQCVASQIGATVFLENHIKTISFCLQGGYSIQLPNVSRVDPSGIGTGKVTKEKDQENWLR